MGDLRHSMIQCLEDAYRRPVGRHCFYSSDGVVPNSARLRAKAAWDWTPDPTARSIGSTCSVPLTFGCPPIALEEGKQWVNPRIFSVEDIDALEVPSPESGETGRILDRIRSVAAEGRAVRNPDIQSPLGIAELMCDSTWFYMTMLDDPEAIHRLLRKVTDFQIAFISAVQRAAGEFYNPCGFPLVWARGTGTMLSDDSMSLLSPEMHLEFSVPYVNEIADRVGPLFYHSCSWRKPYFSNIRKLRNVRAVNWNPGNSDDPAELLREFGGFAMLNLHLVKDMHRTSEVLAWGGQFADEAEFLRYHLENMPENCSMNWWFSNIVQDPVIDRVYDVLDEFGFTPEAALR